MKKYLIYSLVFNILVFLTFLFFMPVQPDENPLNKAIEMKANIVEEDDYVGHIELYVKNNTNKIVKKINYDLKLYRCEKNQCYLEDTISKHLLVLIDPGKVINKKYYIGSFPASSSSNSYRFLDVDVKDISYDFNNEFVSNDLDDPFDH